MNERGVSHDDLMRLLDDEVTGDEEAKIRGALASSTELRRELALYEALRNDVRGLSLDVERPSSVWDAVNRRVTRPIGWILVILGSVVWTGFGAWVFATSAADPVEKLAVAALAVGFLILLGVTIFERMVELKTDPYRDIQR